MMNSSLKLLIHGTRAMVNQNGVGAPPSLMADDDNEDENDGDGNDASLDLNPNFKNKPSSCERRY